MFDPALPVQLRDGRAARIICTDRLTGGPYTIMALIDLDGEEEVRLFRKDGTSIYDIPDLDLVNVSYAGLEDSGEFTNFIATVEVEFTCTQPHMVTERVIGLPFGDQDCGFRITAMKKGQLSPHEDECLLPAYRERHGLEPVVLTPEQRAAQGSMSYEK